MQKYKIIKRFIDSDRTDYQPGDTIELDNEMKITRMKYYGFIGWKPIEEKKRGRRRKPKIERAIIL